MRRRGNDTHRRRSNGVICHNNVSHRAKLGVIQLSTHGDISNVDEVRIVESAGVKVFFCVVLEPWKHGYWKARPDLQWRPVAEAFLKASCLTASDSFQEFPSAAVPHPFPTLKFPDPVQKLTNLNNGLDKILSLHQRNQASEVLIGSILAQYNTPIEIDTLITATPDPVTEPGSSNEPSAKSHDPSQHEALVSMAKVKKMCLLNAGEGNEANPDYKPNEYLVTLVEPPAKTESQVLWPFIVAEYKKEGKKPYKVLVELQPRRALSVLQNIPSSTR